MSERFILDPGAAGGQGCVEYRGECWGVTFMLFVSAEEELRSIHSKVRGRQTEGKESNGRS